MRRNSIHSRWSLRPVPLTRTSRRNNKPSDSYKVPLKLPYVSEEVSSKIRTYIKKKKLAVRPIYTPGRTLNQRFCQSRPLDKRLCTLGNPRNCKICPLITNGTCDQRNLVDRVDCNLCQNIYIIEGINGNIVLILFFTGVWHLFKPGGHRLGDRTFGT